MILPGTVLSSMPGSLAPDLYTIALRAAVNGRDLREDRRERVAISAVG
jgi:hypothetical protein